MKKALIFACLIVLVTVVSSSAAWDEEKGKAEIEKLGDGRTGVGGDHNEIKTLFLGLCERVSGAHDTLVLAFCTDHLNFRAGNVLV